MYQLNSTLQHYFALQVSINISCLSCNIWVIICEELFLIQNAEFHYKFSLNDYNSNTNLAWVCKHS